MTDFEELYPIVKSEVLKNYESKVETKRTRTLGLIMCEDSQFVKPKGLRYFISPLAKSFPLDLNVGYNTYKKRTDDYYKLHLKKLETYLMENNGRSLFKDKEKQPICTTRNALKALLMTPYCLEESWTMKAIKFGNVIYLSKVKINRETFSPHESYHFKFQQYCFADAPYKTPCIDDPINENKQYSCVFEIPMDKFDILYSAEIAAVESKNPITDLENAETLDKCRFILTKLLQDRFAANWKKHPNLLKWWIQCYLGRVQKVHVGFKTQNGFIHKPLESIEAHELPQFQKWKPEVCKRFLCEFLKKLEATMSNVDSPYITYEFKYDKYKHVCKYRIFDHKKEEQFLSDKFIQYMQMK